MCLNHAVHVNGPTAGSVRERNHLHKMLLFHIILVVTNFCFSSTWNIPFSFFLKACQGKGSCVIRILNSAFGGDPCRGIVKTLAVEAKCAPSSTTSSSQLWRGMQFHSIKRITAFSLMPNNIAFLPWELVHMYMVAVMEPGAGSILFFCFRAVNDYW